MKDWREMVIKIGIEFSERFSVTSHFTKGIEMRI